jgi:arsenate reductase-like glutaredoxin family protein
LVAKADNLYVSKGKKVVHVDLKADSPDEETLGKLLLGPTGNLRAPTIRKGKTLLVGFDEATYKKVLSGR